MALSNNPNLESNTLAGIARLGPERREVAMEYYRYMLRKGLSLSTCITYVHFWKTLEPIGKSYKEITEDDLKGWLDSVVKRYSPGTATLLKTKAKKFFQWIHCGERAKKGQYPPIVDWIEINGQAARKRLPRALTKDQVVRLVRSTKNQRDRALFFVTYDSGGRASEVIGPSIGDVRPDKYGAQIRLEGKTGTRLVRLIDSWPDLKKWLEFHPQADDANAPLWPSQGYKSRGNPGRTVDYSHASKLLKMAAQQAGIEGAVSFHTLRHSKATHMAPLVTEALMRMIFGWTPTSPMPAVYVHLSARDSDRAQLEAAGIVIEDARKESRATQPRICPSCRTENSASARFCNLCSMILDHKFAVEMESVSNDFDDINLHSMEIGGMKKALQTNPEAVQLMIGILTQLAGKHE